jgi:type II secretory pathway pseudopilin PulG
MSANRGEEGFSTVEVLVAFSILSLGLALLLQTLAQSAGTTRGARNASDALETARHSTAEASYQPGTGRPGTRIGDLRHHELKSEIGKGSTLLVIRDERGNLVDIALVHVQQEPR